MALPNEAYLATHYGGAILPLLAFGYWQVYTAFLCSHELYQ
jgi:hypothetical protein